MVQCFAVLDWLSEDAELPLVLYLLVHLLPLPLKPLHLAPLWIDHVVEETVGGSDQVLADHHLFIFLLVWGDGSFGGLLCCASHGLTASCRFEVLDALEDRLAFLGLVLDRLIDYAFPSDIWGECASNKFIFRLFCLSRLHRLYLALLTNQAIHV